MKLYQKVMTQHISPFDAIRKVDNQGNEYWSARDLAKLPGYTQYNKFINTIERAKDACRQSGQAVSGHFTHESEMIFTGKGAKHKFDTVFLSRYACYLIVQQVGGEVRQTIERLGGTMPEDLPTPVKGIQQLQEEEQKRLQQQIQPSLFDEELPGQET
jgi:hypothetical protein